MAAKPKVKSAGKIGAWIKTHKKEAIIAAAAIAAGLYFLIKNGGLSGLGSSSATGTTGTTVPVSNGPGATGAPGAPGKPGAPGAPGAPGFPGLPQLPVWKLPTLPGKTNEPATIAHNWGHYNFLEGERAQLDKAMKYERGWLAAAKKAGNKARVNQLTTRLKYQQGTENNLTKQIHNAWLAAKKGTKK